MSMPPQKAKASSTTMIFWWWQAPGGWSVSRRKWIRLRHTSSSIKNGTTWRATVASNAASHCRM
jgi:hypothetical protein